MIDFKKPVRTAYFAALTGKLTFGGQPVPVSDDLKGPSSASLWVILGSQTGAQQNTFNGWASLETIDLDIVYKTTTRASKEPLDLVAAQIFELICPFVDQSGLPVQPGVQIINVRLESDRYLPLSLNNSNTVERRILTFKQYVSQL